MRRKIGVEQGRRHVLALLDADVCRAVVLIGSYRHSCGNTRSTNGGGAWWGAVMPPPHPPDSGRRIAMTWDGARMFRVDPVGWTLGTAAQTRTWATQPEASRVLWAVPSSPRLATRIRRRARRAGTTAGPGAPPRLRISAPAGRKVIGGRLGHVSALRPDC